MSEPTDQASPAYDLADQASPVYDPAAIFDENGPINPHFMHEAVRTLMRALPLDAPEPSGWGHRRMVSAMSALAALHPRDEIEVLLGVQAISAYHAAAACWRLGMNARQPNGDSTRHIATAAATARTFDTLLKALERRQAKPLAVPTGRPPAREWPITDPTSFMQEWEQRVSRDASAAEPDRSSASLPTWDPEEVPLVDELRNCKRKEKENEGLDIANTEGILPGGGMIMPEDPTPHQAKYIGRRLALMYRREYQEDLRNGIKRIPRIRPIRPGDLIP